MKLQLIQEMPWFADTICPHCGITFDADARVETWAMNKPTLKKIINMFMKCRLYALNCPSCSQPMIHDTKRHRTYKYDSTTLKKISPVVQKFLAQTKPSLSNTVKDQFDKNFNIAKIYDLKIEQICFKDYCEILRIDEANVNNTLH